MKKTLSLVLILVMVIGMFVGCTSNESVNPTNTDQSSSEPSDPKFDGVIKMGAVLPLTGPSAESGIACKQGLLIGEAEVNAAGGIKIDGKSYEVKIIMEDDAGSPDQSVSAAEKLLTKDGVSVLFTGCLSSSSLAIMDICDKYPDVLFTTIECTSDNFSKIISENPERYFNFYKPYYGSTDYGAAFGEFVADMSEKGIIDFSNKTVAYMVEDTDAGRSVIPACEAALEKFCGGSTTVAVEVVPQGHTDFYSQINKFKSLDPDVVLTFFVPLNSGVAYVKQTKEIGTEWTDVAIVYPLKAGFIEQTGQNSEGLFWFPQQADFENNPEVKAFAEKVYETFPDAGLNAMHVSSYIGVGMVKEAIEKAGTTNARDGLAEAYGNLDYQSINGRYVFKDDHTSLAGPDYLAITVAQVQDQHSNVVWPENAAFSEPVPQK
ncbi:MAG: ABC transporter substrate-binding protein [Clostridiaceae bacterium]|nr:ABC transporter substrate-binding protein [Clostridiaceae bacterium]